MVIKFNSSSEESTVAVSYDNDGMNGLFYILNVIDLIKIQLDISLTPSAVILWPVRTYVIILRNKDILVVNIPKDKIIPRMYDMIFISDISCLKQIHFSIKTHLILKFYSLTLNEHIMDYK